MTSSKYHAGDAFGLMEVKLKTHADASEYMTLYENALKLYKTTCLKSQEVQEKRMKEQLDKLEAEAGPPRDRTSAEAQIE